MALLLRTFEYSLILGTGGQKKAARYWGAHMILVTGVTGRVGQAAAHALLKGDYAVRGLVRDLQRLDRRGLEKMDVVTADLTDPASIDEAMAGIRCALLVTGNSDRQLELESNFVASAEQAGVQNIVKVSALGAGSTASTPIPKIHFAVEQLIKQSSMNWTILQPNFFMQNLLMQAPSIAETNQFALPLATASTALVDCADVGEAAAVVLSGAGHAGRTYVLAGAELYSFAQVARVLTEAIGRDIHYVDQDPNEFREILGHFVESKWHVNAVCELFAEIKAGALESMSTDLEDLLGRKPTSLEDFAHRHRAMFG